MERKARKEKRLKMLMPVELRARLRVARRRRERKERTMEAQARPKEPAKRRRKERRARRVEIEHIPSKTVDEPSKQTNYDANELFMFAADSASFLSFKTNSLYFINKNCFFLSIVGIF